MFASLFRAQPAPKARTAKARAARDDRGREAGQTKKSKKGAAAAPEGSLSKSQRRKQRRKQEKLERRKPQEREGSQLEDSTSKKTKGKKMRDQEPAGGFDFQKAAAPKRKQKNEDTGVLGKAATRLKGSRFRWLNETLYTMTGDEALDLFSKDPSLAEAYHEGFRAQASKWPRNPLDEVIRWLKEEVPRQHVIGDFGCGDVRLALELKDRTVHSFDLVQINSRVTACNLAAVPLPKASLNVAVFCLALMGTDWTKFVAEARRCLKLGGLCHIVEVESRFADVEAVVRTIESLGFQQLMVKPGSFFVEMRFRATKKDAQGRKSKGQDALLQACTYRKR